MKIEAEMLAALTAKAADAEMRAAITAAKTAGKKEVLNLLGKNAVFTYPAPTLTDLASAEATIIGIHSTEAVERAPDGSDVDTAVIGNTEEPMLLCDKLPMAKGVVDVAFFGNPFLVPIIRKIDVSIYAATAYGTDEALQLIVAAEGMGLFSELIAGRNPEVETAPEAKPTSIFVPGPSSIN